MILRVLAVSMIGLSLAGCVSSSGLSGDVYSASEAKQVQSVTYGTSVHTRAVQIQSGDDSNAIGAIGGAVLGGFLGNTIGRYWPFSGNRSRRSRRRRRWPGRTGCDEQNSGR